MMLMRLRESVRSRKRKDSEEVISLDLEDDSLLYRVRRGPRILYVEVEATEIIPKADRTESGAILRHLRPLPVWSLTDWETLSVSGPIESPTCRCDAFQPHSLQPSDLIQGTPRYDFTSIKQTERYSDRVFKGTGDNKVVVIKIARFKHELSYLRQELKAYEGLRAKGFAHMPEIYGYVFEERADRVIGFAMEYLRGEHVGRGDLEECRKVLTLVHDCGYVLGDINRYNWIRTDHGIKVIDFETALEQSQAKMWPSDELEALPARLSDTSGVGRH